MASHRADVRCAMQRRDSTRSYSKTRRPKLLRASVTEPSITTSNASRGAFASPEPSRRATELLTQMAYVSRSPTESLYRSTPASAVRSPMLERDDLYGSSPSSSHDGSFEDYPSHGQSARYFSFPSFDTWDMEQQEEEKEDPIKSP